jgi:2-polyprenyl-3-methyl-5-hydroxy-6-metoxy-1,4-benzoquinol methylase
MHAELLEVLRCPETGKGLQLAAEEVRAGEVFSGWLFSEGNGRRYPIREFIPRFMPESNCADNFGLQWSRFRKTQLDSYSGHPISAFCFWQATGWEPESLEGKWVLDVGCGAGRFAEVALRAGAKVVALDYSSAVNACYENLKGYPNLVVIQGDIYQLPLRKGFFPFVYSLGVLQHTPEVARAFACLPPLLSAGGQLVVDVYEKRPGRMLLPKYWLRPITTRIPQDRLFKILQQTVPTMLRTSNRIQRVPIVGPLLKCLVPVANYAGIYPLSPSQHLEWSLLDTFDWLAPENDQPQTSATLR